MDTTTCSSYFYQNVKNKDRILLVNPPVADHRYAWVKWNQPLDLLKLSTFLKSEKNCEVRLYDFMKPQNGKVRRTNAVKPKFIQVNGESFAQYMWGKPLGAFRRYLDKEISPWGPDHIVISTLTSYWWKGLREAVQILRMMFPNVPCILYGNYAVYESQHAEHHVFPHGALADYCDELEDFPTDFDIYEGEAIEFCAISPSYANWPTEVEIALHKGVDNFVFFSDRLLGENSSTFRPNLAGLTNIFDNLTNGERPSFLGICGIYPEDIDAEGANQLERANFREIYLEHDFSSGRPNIQIFEQARTYLDKAYDKSNRPKTIGAFMMIGTPTDELDDLIEDLLSLHEVVGQVILKPFTPSPGSKLYATIRDSSDSSRLEHLSPHLFPIGKQNGITTQEYREIFSLATLLNDRVLGDTWDLLPGDLGYELFAESLRREIWKIGEHEKGASD